MHKLILAIAAFLAVPLTACQTVIPTTPVIVANSTVLDEKAALAIETAYAASARTAALLIKTGVIKDTATIATIGKLDNQAYAAVKLSREAYNAGNASSYAAALPQALTAVRALYAAVASR